MKIVCNSFIGDGVIIPENIPEGSFARGKIELKISENKASADKSREDMKSNLK